MNIKTSDYLFFLISKSNVSCCNKIQIFNDKIHHFFRTDLKYPEKHIKLLIM